jgi:hypothetical protein
MNCKTCRIEIEDSNGVRPLSQVANIHIESCANCLLFSQERQALKKMINNLEIITAPPDFDFRLRARLAALKSQKSSGFWGTRFAPGGWSLALAASFVILVAVGVVVRQALLNPVAGGASQEVVDVRPPNAPASVAPSNIPQTPQNDDKDGQASSAGPSQIITLPRGVSRSFMSPRSAVARSNARVASDIGGSLDSAVSSAATVLPLGIPDPTLTRSVGALPLRASMRATRIMVNDGKARSQTISLRPVTFGGQELFEESTSKRIPIPTSQGVW